MMQDSKKMNEMLNDVTQYIMRPSVKYARALGTYVSYDIAAYDTFERDYTAIVLDVTPDRELALQMCERFNRYRLDPCQLEEAIQDMLA